MDLFFGRLIFCHIMGLFVTFTNVMTENMTLNGFLRGGTRVGTPLRTSLSTYLVRAPMIVHTICSKKEMQTFSLITTKVKS